MLGGKAMWKSIRRILRRSRSEESGATILEFAIAAPFGLMLFAGTINIVTLLQEHQAASRAVYEALRLASVTEGLEVGTDNGSHQQVVKSRLEGLLEGRGLTYEYTSLTYNGPETQGGDDLVSVKVRLVTKLPFPMIPFPRRFMSSTLSGQTEYLLSNFLPSTDDGLVDDPPCYRQGCF